MKFVAKFKERLIDNKYNAHLKLVVENNYHIKHTEELEEDVEYVVEVKKARSKRSIQQNRLLWKLLAELEHETGQDMMDWYIYALEDSDCKHEYLLGTDDIYDNLLKSFRAVRKVGKRMVNDVELTMFKAFYGSSKFNVKEMNQLIDIVMGYCHESGIDTELIKLEE